MTAAGLHELTALRQRLVRIRAGHAAQGDQLDDLFDLVSRMEDAAQNSEGMFAGTPAKDLSFGYFVKVGDEWLQLVGRDGNGRLELVGRDGYQRTFYEPSEGERFLTDSPF